MRSEGTPHSLMLYCALKERSSAAPHRKKEIPAWAQEAVGPLPLPRQPTARAPAERRATPPMVRLCVCTGYLPTQTKYTASIARARDNKTPG